MLTHFSAAGWRGRMAGFLAAMFALSGCVSHPQLPPPASIVNEGVNARIVKYGTYTTRGPQLKRFDPNVPNQISSMSMETVFVEQTARVPGRLGTKFGVWFQISGLPRQSIAELQAVITHPPIKGADGKETSRSFFQVLAGVDHSGFGRGMAGYGIEEPYEIAHGEWTIEIKRAGDVLLRQKFYMYRVRE